MRKGEQSPAKTSDQRHRRTTRPTPRSNSGTVRFTNRAPPADTQPPAALTGNHHPLQGDPSQVSTGTSHATQRKDRAGKPTGNANTARRCPSISQGQRTAKASTPTLMGRRSKSKNDNRRRYRYRHRDRPRRAYTDKTSKEARC
ncbi:hypothetical protein WOLCODRAFT_153152 [Wolfiporia cocos MD-104 SS10]|uniref:Uncharacterized protein n=1 Tax=Wolfiporia cocos (strain MD-104) TaxID=742152 RepID=A0A2H3JLL5_WOLCO|nr:hypothetical protein WOLCODRAFT_153152 [Wolfiporia cocos MD-104 SS10]